MKNKNSPGMSGREISKKKIITANFPRLVVSERENEWDWGEVVEKNCNFAAWYAIFT